MSHRTYNALWHSSQVLLNEQIVKEGYFEQAPPEKDKKLALYELRSLYVRYVVIIRHLDLCFDQIVHPQKRLLLRCLLDNTIGRLLEVRQEMVNLELAEYPYLDDVMLELKLLPNEAQAPVPKYYIKERETEIENRDEKLKAILKKLGYIQDKDDQQEVMTIEEAVKLIQIHERARQGRLRARFMKAILEQEKASREATLAPRPPPTMAPEKAAIMVQARWRGHKTRKLVEEFRQEEMLFIGMVARPPNPNPPHIRAREVEEERRKVQAENYKNYEMTLTKEMKRIKTQESGRMTEEIQDQIRTWFQSSKEMTGKYPDYPSDDEGGSAAIFNEEMQRPDSSTRSTPADEKGRKGKKDKDKEKKTKKDKTKEEEEEEEGFKMQHSNFLADLQNLNEKYKRIWLNRDETRNRHQTCDIELIQEEKRQELEMELRKEIDGLMRDELEQLKEALERDLGRKGKKKGTKRKKKGGGAGKRGKKKKDKDLTPDRTTESLFEELVMQGIIKQFPKVHLTSFLGADNVAGSVAVQRKGEMKITAMDVKRAVVDYCILPLGSPIIHEKSPLLKSVLLAGPKGVGKKMLVYAMCTEVGATLLDLTAANIAGKYPGKAGLTMLVHLVSKVSRLLQPSVIWIDEAEKTFMKKIPKQDKTDPKRLKKDLPKLVKSVGPEDRVLFVGTSRQPWHFDVKSLAQTYHKVILIPKPTYGDRYSIWKSCISQKVDPMVVMTRLDISGLSKISDGYTQGSIVRAVAEVLTERRMRQIKRKAIQTKEFVGPLARQEIVYRDEEEAFETWYQSKTPLGRRKQKFIEAQKEAEEEKKKAGKVRKKK